MTYSLYVRPAILLYTTLTTTNPTRAAMPQATVNPYEQLSIDPFAVAHHLQMPAAIFSAFKKTMCAGSRGHKDALTDYNQAICSLTRYKKDLHDELVIHYLPLLPNEHFINEVLFCYHNNMQSITNGANNETIHHMMGFAYLAGIKILNLYHPDYAQIPVNHLIDDAINNLNAALYYARQLSEKGAV
jgi:hypothetical protein